MRELLDFLAVFAAIYCFDCVHWARRGSLGFRAWWRRVRVVADEAMPGNERYGVVLAQPLPPFGRLFLTEAFPLSLTRDCAVSFVSAAANPGLRPRQVQRVLSLDKPFRVTTEARRVLVDGELFVEAGSPQLARLVTARLLELARMDPMLRESRIDEWVSASLDVGAAADRIRAFDRVAPLVRAACAAQLALVFVVTPLVGFTFGLARVWVPLVVGLVALQACIAWSFVRAHRQLHPREKRAGRVEAALIALSPPTAMRAFDSLSRDLLADFHPLAAAATLLSPEEFAVLLESTLRDALAPLPFVRESPDENLRAAADAWRRRNLEALEAFARRAGVLGTPWREAPVQADSDYVAYCPRCARQYTRADGGCERCLSLPLKSFTTT